MMTMIMTTMKTQTTNIENSSLFGISNMEEREFNVYVEVDVPDRKRVSF